LESFSVGVDLGGTNLRVATYEPKHGFRDRISVRTRLHDGPDPVVEDICRLIRDAITSRKDSAASCLGVCVAAPGPLELPSGRFHQPPNLPGWDGFDFRQALEKRLDIPVFLENDANVAALAECHLGSGKELGVDNICMLTLGTGVGNGIVSNGRIVHGANGLAGEAGHISVQLDGELCNCGNHGCLEVFASARAIQREAIRLAKQGAPGLARLLEEQPEATAGDFYSLAISGDAEAQSIFDRAGRAMGICIASLINTLNPALVAIAGGVSDAWPLLSPNIFKELLHRSYIYRLTQPGSRSQQPTIVRRATLGADAGLAGATLYPFIYGERSI
jgi:glucokinase